MSFYRVGSGWDVHRLVPGGKPFILGGVLIEYPFGLVAHSDGDVIAHSLSDALLSAVGEDDIGSHFPDDNPQWENLRGEEMVSKVRSIITDRGYSIVNVVTTVFAQYPKLKPYRKRIKENLAEWLQIDPSHVAVHFNTVERIGVLGAGAAIGCHSMVLVEQKI